MRDNNTVTDDGGRGDPVVSALGKAAQRHRLNSRSGVSGITDYTGSGALGLQMLSRASESNVVQGFRALGQVVEDCRQMVITALNFHQMLVERNVIDSTDEISLNESVNALHEVMQRVEGNRDYRQIVHGNPADIERRYGVNSNDRITSMANYKRAFAKGSRLLEMFQGLIGDLGTARNSLSDHLEQLTEKYEPILKNLQSRV